MYGSKILKVLKVLLHRPDPSQIRCTSVFFKESFQKICPCYTRNVVRCNFFPGGEGSDPEPRDPPGLHRDHGGHVRGQNHRHEHCFPGSPRLNRIQGSIMIIFVTEANKKACSSGATLQPLYYQSWYLYQMVAKSWARIRNKYFPI